MSYEKLNLTSGTVLGANHLAHIEDGIKNNSTDVENLKVDKADKSTIGKANGIAQLDNKGMVDSTQLPDGLTVMKEYDNRALFPQTGEKGNIYVDTSTDLTYRWNGIKYLPFGSGGGGGGDSDAYGYIEKETGELVVVVPLLFE